MGSIPIFRELWCTLSVEQKIKDPHTCEHYNEVGCIKDICTCYSLTPDTLVNHQNKTVLIGTYE
jgi:hypothetical protein